MGSSPVGCRLEDRRGFDRLVEARRTFVLFKFMYPSFLNRLTPFLMRQDVYKSHGVVWW